MPGKIFSKKDVITTMFTQQFSSKRCYNING